MDPNLPFIIAGIMYVLSCIVVGAIADERGWGGIFPTVVAFIATPLIAAILYAPYKKEESKSSET